MAFGPTSLALTFIAGLCFAAGIQHSANATRTHSLQDRAYAVACFFLSLSTAATLGYNNAPDADQYRFWYQWHLLLTRAVFLLWPWIILRFAGLNAPWMLRAWFGFEALRALLLLIHFDRPYFFDVKAVGWVLQPWGERIAYPIGRAMALQPLQLLSPLLGSAFTMAGAVRLWRLGRRVDAGFLVFLATGIYGMLLLDNLADTLGWPDVQVAELVILGPVAFLGWRASERLHEATLAIRAATQAREEERRLASLGTLAGGLAHEINNVLMAVWGQLELARNANADAERGAALQRADGSLRLGRETIQRVLRFAREAPEGAERRGAEVGVTLRDTAALLRPLLPANISLECEDDSRGAAVPASASELQQALMNLGLNAAQAMAGRGGRLRYGARLEGGQALLTVQDDGPGMSEAVRQRVFEPFFSTKKASGGNGLGLAVVHGMVLQHGGTIRCESAPGEGARFTLSFPLLPGDGQAAAPPGPAPAAAPPEQTAVMVLDDEPDLRESLRRILASLGYQALAAAGLDEALQGLAQAPARHRVLLTDLNMPLADGHAALAAARRAIAGVKVILSTGDDTEDVQAGGFDAVLFKPYSPQELGDCLRSLCREPSGTEP